MRRQADQIFNLSLTLTATRTLLAPDVKGALVDPGTTAIWEMRLADVVVDKANFRAVIDEIAGEANRLITVLRQHNGGTVD